MRWPISIVCAVVAHVFAGIGGIRVINAHGAMHSPATVVLLILNAIAILSLVSRRKWARILSTILLSYSLIRLFGSSVSLLVQGGSAGLMFGLVQLAMTGLLVWLVISLFTSNAALSFPDSPEGSGHSADTQTP